MNLRKREMYPVALRTGIQRDKSYEKEKEWYFGSSHGTTKRWDVSNPVVCQRRREKYLDGFKGIENGKPSNKIIRIYVAGNVRVKPRYGELVTTSYTQIWKFNLHILWIYFEPFHSLKQKKINRIVTQLIPTRHTRSRTRQERCKVISKVKQRDFNV